MKNIEAKIPLEEKDLKAKGHVRIAFYDAFNSLLSDMKYEDYIKSIIKRGGDTDTNACIAGAMIGCAVGFNNLP